MTTIQISHKIEIASPSNKFKTYCRKAFGISRLAYNWALGRILEQRAQAIADAYKITAIVAPINKAPVLIAAPTPKPKKKIPYVKVSAQISNLPMKDIEGILGVAELENGKNLIVISVNEKGKYSQIIADAFYKQVK